MDKLKMHSPNLVDSNIEKIAALFPNCVTEAQGENGELKKAIDFELLKQELSQVLVEGEQERYRLDWVGKKEAILTANAPIAKTLRPCREESVNFDKTENLFIEGDNLEALKLLQENYLGKVKLIYIDPPYNTGNDFIYEDDFAESIDAFFEKSHQIDEDGNRLIANTESNGRFHSDWLSMVYSRLKLARNLLSDDGSILISIDDNEQENLKKICDEVFGSKNFINQFVWKKNSSGKTVSKQFPTNIEYVLMYSKNFLAHKFNVVYKPLSEATLKMYNKDDNDGRGKYRLYPLQKTGGAGPETTYDYVDNNGKVWPCPAKGWRMNKEKLKKLENDGRLEFGNSTLSEKAYWNERDSEGKVADTLWDDIDEGNVGTAEVSKLFGFVAFNHPKPTGLLKRIIELGTDQDSIILDFYSGSSTTADAVFQINMKDQGQRKILLVQIPEDIDVHSEMYKKGYKTIAEISKERIRRAGKKILEDNANKEGIENLDIGFRVLKIDSTNMKDVYYTPDALKQADMLDLASNIKEDRTSEDLLFQVMLDWGLELSLPIERKTIAGKEVFYVAGNSLVACFDDLTFDVVDEVAKDRPLRFVSAEKAIHLDHHKTNIKERFKQLSRDTEVKFL
ncbi:site-specific DNA-methyltransferase [Acinetobacter sp. BSP-28]|uniref:site-specific DNA-methyltransferase n=1 Tax=Acinetobacter sp. BSP-28 TaxID=3344661 RepID=UPI00376FC8B4